MYLPIGADFSVRTRCIIGIFDMDRTTISKITRKYLSEAEKNHLVSAANEDEIPKSFVLYKDPKDGQNKICFSLCLSI